MAESERFLGLVERGQQFPPGVNGQHWSVWEAANHCSILAHATVGFDRLNTFALGETGEECSAKYVGKLIGRFAQQTGRPVEEVGGLDVEEAVALTRAGRKPRTPQKRGPKEKNAKRDARLVELDNQGLDEQEIVEQLVAEGYTRIKPGSIRQIRKRIRDKDTM
jgi:hypothetical protein